MSTGTGETQAERCCDQCAIEQDVAVGAGIPHRRRRPVADLIAPLRGDEGGDGARDEHAQHQERQGLDDDRHQQGRPELQRGTVEELGDQAAAAVAAVLDGKATTYHSVVVSRTGRVVNILDASRPGEEVPMTNAAAALE